MTCGGGEDQRIERGPKEEQRRDSEDEVDTRDGRGEYGSRRVGEKED